MSATARDPRQLLGLEPDADPAEIERHYRELQSFLDLRLVPRSLRPWAIRQRALVDEAYAALAGDLDRDDGEPGGVAEESPETEDEESAEDDESALDPELSATSPPVASPTFRDPITNGKPTARGYLGQAPQSTGSAGLLEIVTEDERRTVASRPVARPQLTGRPSSGRARGGADPSERAPSGQSKPLVPQGRASAGRAQAELAASAGPRLSQPWQRVALGLVLGLAVLGALYVGTKGLPAVGSAPAQSTAPSAEARQQQAQLDQQRVAELKAIVEKDPTNRDALFELGEMNIQAGKWQESLDWFTKLLAVDPDNVHARMDVGTDNFNLGRTAEAKAAWEEVARRNPGDPQIHYNLGFLYANAQGKERDVEAARREWQKVAELAPDTELARIAQSSLDALPKVGQ